MTIEYLTERCARFTWVARRYHPVIFGWLAERYRLRIQLRNSMSYSRALVAATVALLLAACGNSDPDLAQYGPNPELPEPRRGLLPDMIHAGTSALGRSTAHRAGGLHRIGYQSPLDQVSSRQRRWVMADIGHRPPF